ncbi:hypothetical protein BJ742DRAFT_865857 [Cladochytrium replicatum]|nr:hypothetical protein BJ742DRAFT_865857 [Cladochytrium replicatum]
MKTASVPSVSESKTASKPNKVTPLIQQTQALAAEDETRPASVDEAKKAEASPPLHIPSRSAANVDKEILGTKTEMHDNADNVTEKDESASNLSEEIRSDMDVNRDSVHNMIPALVRDKSFTLDDGYLPEELIHHA